MTSKKQLTKGKPVDVVLWKKPPGYTDIAAILRAYDENSPLPADELKRIVAALRVFMVDGETDKHLQEFGRRARLRGKQGRHEQTWTEAEPQVSLAFSVVAQERKLKKENNPRAHAQAVEEIANAASKHPRTVQRAYAEYGELARAEYRAADKALRDAVKMNELIEGLQNKHAAIAQGLADAIKKKARDTKS